MEPPTVVNITTNPQHGLLRIPMTLESYSAAAVPIDCSQATVPDQIVPTGTTGQASRQVVSTDHDVLRLHPNPPHELPNIPYPVKKLDPYYHTTARCLQNCSF